MIEEVQTQDFKFRQLAKVKVSGPTTASAKERCSLLCVSNEFGLTFVGCNEGVQVFQTRMLFVVNDDDNLKHKADISTLKASLLPIPAPPLDVSLSCDSLTLSVCFREGRKVKFLFFDTRILASEAAQKDPFCSITPNTAQDVHLCGVQWNPSVDQPDLLVISLSTGLQLLSVKDDVTVLCSNPNIHATSVCWSPKGKQIAVGLKNGQILQLLHKKGTSDFDQKKCHSCPDVFNGKAMEICDLYWVSTFVFALVLIPQSGQDRTPSSVFLLPSKDGPTKCINAEDVFYGKGSKENKFFFSYISQWNILISSSSNGPEAAVFSHQKGEQKGEWQKYELDDGGRAEFPLDETTNKETFACGMAIDKTSQKEIVINTDLTLPPCPLLLLLSDHGVLSPFTILNMSYPTADLKEMINPPKSLPSAPIRSIKTPGQSLTSGQILGSGRPPGPGQQSSLRQTLGSGPGMRIPAPQGSNAGVRLMGPGQTLSLSMGQPRGPPPGAIQPQAARAPPRTGLVIPSMPLAVASSTPKGPPTSQPQQSTNPSTATLTLKAQQSTAHSLPPGELLAPSGGPQFSPHSVKLSPSQSTTSTTAPRPLGMTPAMLSQLGGPPVYSSTPLGQTLPPGHTHKQFPPPSLHPPQGMKPHPMSQASLAKNNSGSVVPAATPIRTNEVTGGIGAGVSGGIFGGISGGVSGGVGVSVSGVSGGISGVGVSVSAKKLEPTIVSQSQRQAMGTPQQQQQQQQQQAKGMPLYQQQQATGTQQQQQRQAMGTPQQQQQQQQQAKGMPLYQQQQATGTQHQQQRQAMGTQQQQTKGLPQHQVAGTPHPQHQQQQQQAKGTPQYHQQQTTGISQQWQVTGTPQHQQQQAKGTSQYQQHQATNTPQHQQQITGTHQHQEEVDGNFPVYIREAAEKFAEEIEDLKKTMSDAFGEWEAMAEKDLLVKGLGKLDDLQRIEEEISEVQTEVMTDKKQFKELKQKCEQMEEDTLRVLEVHEQTRGELTKRNDRNYASLQRLRPLDGLSSSRLTDTRAKFLQVRQSLDEVTSELDSQLERWYEEKRQENRDPMKVPSLHIIYSSLKDHHRITRLQNIEVERLVERMKTMKLIPHSWEPSHYSISKSPSTRKSPISPFSRTSPSPIGFKTNRSRTETLSSKGEEETPMKKDEKMRKLKEYFSSMTLTPVRKVTTVPKHTLSPTHSELSSANGSGVSLPLQTGNDYPDRGSVTYMVQDSNLNSNIFSAGLVLQKPLNQAVDLSPRPQPPVSVPPANIPSVPPHHLSRNSSRSTSQSSLSTNQEVEDQTRIDLGQNLNQRRVPQHVHSRSLSASQSSIASSYSSLEDHDVTLTGGKKYDILVSPDGKIADNTGVQQRVFSFHPTTTTCTQPFNSLSIISEGHGGTIHYKPPQDSLTSFPPPGPGSNTASVFSLTSMSHIFPNVTAIQLPPSTQPSITHPNHSGLSKFKIPSNPPLNVYSKTSEGGTVLHGSLPQLSGRGAPPPVGMNGNQGELRKTDGINNLTLIGPEDRTVGGIGSLLSNASSASVPNVNTPEAPAKGKIVSSGEGISAAGVSRMQSTPVSGSVMTTVAVSRLQSVPVSSTTALTKPTGSLSSTTPANSVLSLSGNLFGAFPLRSQAPSSSVTPTVSTSAPTTSSSGFNFRLPTQSVNLFKSFSTESAKQPNAGSGGGVPPSVFQTSLKTGLFNVPSKPLFTPPTTSGSSAPPASTTGLICPSPSLGGGKPFPFASSSSTSSFVFGTPPSTDNFKFGGGSGGSSSKDVPKTHSEKTSGNEQKTSNFLTVPVVSAGSKDPFTNTATTQGNSANIPFFRHASGNTPATNSTAARASSTATSAVSSGINASATPTSSSGSNDGSDTSKPKGRLQQHGSSEQRRDTSKDDPKKDKNGAEEPGKSELTGLKVGTEKHSISTSIQHQVTGVKDSAGQKVSSDDSKIAKPPTSTETPPTAPPTTESLVPPPLPTTESLTASPPLPTTVPPPLPTPESLTVPPPPTTESLPTALPTTESLPTAPPTTESLPTAPPTTGSLPTALPTTESLPTAPPTTGSLPTAPPTTESLPTAPPTSESLPAAPPTTESLPTTLALSSSSAPPSTTKPFPMGSLSQPSTSLPTVAAPHQLSVSKRESNDQDSLAGANEEDDDVMADYMDSNDIEEPSSNNGGMGGMGSLSMGFGLGGQPSNPTRNPFGTPASSLSTPRPSSGPLPSSGGLLKQSALGSLSASSFPSNSPSSISQTGSNMGGGLGAESRQTAFGGGAAFGASPSFGSAPMFDSPPGAPPGGGSILGSGRLFGSSGSGGFGSSGGSEVSFGALANQQSGPGGGAFGGLGATSNMSGSSFSGWR